MKEVDKKFNYVYKITNNINGHYYIGKRSCNCQIKDDDYMGSGVALQKAYKKYSIQNFSKEILSTHDTWQLAYEHEALLVTRDIINLPECYNMKNGGFYNECIHSDIVKEKISKSVKLWIKNNPEKHIETTRLGLLACQTKEANEKRKLSCKIGSTKYHNGRAGKRDNHTAYNIWIMRNKTTNKETISYNGLVDLPINKGTVLSRMQRMGLPKDRLSELTIFWTQGKHKDIEINRIPKFISFTDIR